MYVRADGGAPVTPAPASSRVHTPVAGSICVRRLFLPSLLLYPPNT